MGQQMVIRLLSLRSTGKSTGRISYAKLGIGQLGAVYETLISFTGVVAKTDLIELKPRKGRSNDAAEDGEEAEAPEPEEDAEEDLFGEDEADRAERGHGGIAHGVDHTTTWAIHIWGSHMIRITTHTKAQ